MQTKHIPKKILNQILSGPFRERFWNNVKVGGLDECWPWKKSIIEGRGHTSIGGTKNPFRHLNSSRVAWMISHRSAIPDGKAVLHKCIACGWCCNPRHLKLGTQQQNMVDMERQGRRFRKLTADQVINIRKTFRGIKGEQTRLSKKFHVSDTLIRLIVQRKAWTHI